MPRRQPTSTLPPDLEHVTGLRVGRWLRESTPGQMNQYGPAAQTRLIDDAIVRHGLIDTGIQWTVAASGWKRAWLTPEWASMLQAARDGAFDLIITAYVDRYLRNLKQTLISIEDHFHPAGVAVLFVDERILSSDPNQWHDLVEEAVAAERYSRRMAKRQCAGHAAKRGLGEPGGRPPFGFQRDRPDAKSPPVLAEIPDRIALVRQVFEWSASGLTDGEVAERANLRKTHVTELLVNDFYRGILSDGSRREPPVIEAALWEQVLEQRRRHARRHPGPVSYRQFPLSGLVFCRACGRRLTGHGDRYEHVEACAEFVAARPTDGPVGRTKGYSYARAQYEGPVRESLTRLSVGRILLTEVQAAVSAQAAGEGPDQLALVRITRQRREAAERVTRDRDYARLEAEMDRLDGEEVTARVATRAAVSAREVEEYLADLPGLYDAAEPATQKRILQALFERIEVLGSNRIWLIPSTEAEERGLGPLFTGEFRTKVRQSGRGERI